MSKEEKVAIAIAIIIFCLGIAFMLCSNFTDDSAGMDTQTNAASLVGGGAALITVKELQAQLVELGYDIKVDGKVCDGWNAPGHSETITAWVLAVCEQYAQPIMDSYMKSLK